jgi:predicted metal-dependent phosphoesterase TrpH
METTRRKADLHVHSNVSYDVPDLPFLAPRALFERALGERGMDYFTLTDHDTMDGYAQLVAQLGEADRRLVIPGVEHTLLDPHIGFSIHVNLFQLDPDTYARLRGEVVTLEDLIWFCEEEGILAQYNHPTWFEHAELRRGQVELAKVAFIAECFDVLEFNAGRPARLNETTAALARVMGKVLTANSDTHSGDIGLAYNLAAGETAAAFLHNIWAGSGERVTSSMTYRGMVGVVHHLIDRVLDDRDGLLLVKSMLVDQNPVVQALALRLLNSRWLREVAVARETSRHLLKQVGRAMVLSWLVQERSLERAIGDSPLAAYFAGPEAA